MVAKRCICHVVAANATLWRGLARASAGGEKTGANAFGSLHYLVFKELAGAINKLPLHYKGKCCARLGREMRFFGHL